jgi:hypothetical protein
MHDQRSPNLQSMRSDRILAKAQTQPHPLSQTWLDGLAVLLGLALATSAYLGWMSASRAQDGDYDVSIQALD